MCYLEPSIVFKAKVARHVRIGFMFYLTMFVDLAFESMFLTPSIVRKDRLPCAHFMNNSLYLNKL
jgi:hypothetical protein